MKTLLAPLAMVAVFFLAACSQMESPDPSITTDAFSGSCRQFVLSTATNQLAVSNLECHLLTQDNTHIVRNVVHKRIDGISTFTMEPGLKEGLYRLLYFIYGDEEFGLGAMVEASKGEVQVLSSYDADRGFFGKGTAENPYIISSASHLKRLALAVNSPQINQKLTRDTHFLQTNDINIYTTCYAMDNAYGWPGIGASSSTPFTSTYDGGGHTISGLWMNREFQVGVGLFPFIRGAYIKNAHISDSYIVGMAAVGSLVGAMITSGEKRHVSYVVGCSLSSSTVNFQDKSSDTRLENLTACNDFGFGVGGLVGFVDENTVAQIDSCLIRSDCSVAGGYSVGGILGAGTYKSRSVVSRCINEGAPISCGYSSAGGIIGSADSISVFASENYGNVTGQILDNPDMGIVGAGGILGGSGGGLIIACSNYGIINGKRGVGGIAGSSLFSHAGEITPVYNEISVAACSNRGSVSGYSHVGGICGEAQLSASGCYNRGAVSAQASDSFVGGIVGLSPISVLDRNANFGRVTGNSLIGGIIGNVTLGMLSINENYGEVVGEGQYVGGIVALAGCESIIHYCSNFNTITNSFSGGCTGGIVGEIGDPRTWTGLEIAGVVIGCLEIPLGFFGPIMAMAGTFAEEGSKVPLILTGIVSIIDLVFLLSDATFTIISIVDLASPVSQPALFEKTKQLISEKVNDNSAVIASEAEQFINSTNFSLDGGLKKDMIIQYSNNKAALVDFLNDNSNDNANYKLFEENVNKVRAEYARSIDDYASLQDLTHTLISGACFVGSIYLLVWGGAVALIGTFASAGAAGPALVGLLVSAVGGYVTIIGGVNAIVSNSMQLADNCAIVSQCVNGGMIVSDSNPCAGIVGHLQDNCLTKDCLNFGPSGPHHRGSAVVGVAESNAKVNNSINVGSGWNMAMFQIEGFGQDYHNNYCFADNNNITDFCIPLSLAQLCLESSYNEWSFGDRGMWAIPEATQGFFPVPFRSQMQY